MNPPEPVAPVGSGGINMIPFCGTFSVYYVLCIFLGHGQMILAGKIWLGAEHPEYICLGDI